MSFTYFTPLHILWKNDIYQIRDRCLLSIYVCVNYQLWTSFYSLTIYQVLSKVDLVFLL